MEGVGGPGDPKTISGTKKLFIGSLDRKIAPGRRVVGRRIVLPGSTCERIRAELVEGEQT